MTRAQLRTAIASFGLAAVGVAGFWLTADPAVEQTKDLPTGDVWTVLYGGPMGLPPAVCDGLDCDDSPTGLERVLCEARGAGFVRNADGTRYVDGWYRDIVLLQDASGQCLAKVRAYRAQWALMRQVRPGGDFPAPLVNAAELLRADPGFGKRYSQLPPAVRAVVRGHHWAGHAVEDDRAVNDDGEPMDGGGA